MSASARPIVTKGSGPEPDVYVGEWPEHEPDLRLTNAINRHSEALEALLPHIVAIGETAGATLQLGKKLRKWGLILLTIGSVMYPTVGKLINNSGPILQSIGAALENAEPATK